MHFDVAGSRRSAYTRSPASTLFVVSSWSPCSKCLVLYCRALLCCSRSHSFRGRRLRNQNPTWPPTPFKSVNVAPSRTGPITQYFALSVHEGGSPTLGACPMQVYLDQVPLPSPFNLDLLPPPRDLAGIEVYAGPATIPPQFNGADEPAWLVRAARVPPKRLHATRAANWLSADDRTGRALVR